MFLLKCLVSVSALCLASAQGLADPDVDLFKAATAYFNAFPVKKEMQPYYGNDSEIMLQSAHLPFGGKFHGAEEAEEFFEKLGNSIAFNSRQYEIKYLDGRTGNVGVLLRLMDGRFRGRVLDEKLRFFTGDDYVDTFHYIEFKPDGTIKKHEIRLQDPAKVFEHSAPVALQHLLELEKEFYKSQGELSADSPLMDLISDDVVLTIDVDPEMLGGNTTFVGKEGLADFVEEMHKDGYLNTNDEDEEEDEDEEDDDKKAGKGRNLLQAETEEELRKKLAELTGGDDKNETELEGEGDDDDDKNVTDTDTEGDDDKNATDTDTDTDDEDKDDKDKNKDKDDKDKSKDDKNKDDKNKDKDKDERAALTSDSKKDKKTKTKPKEGDDEDDEEETATFVKFPDEFNSTILFADSTTVYQKLCYKLKNLRNGNVLRDFDEYRVFDFDEQGLLTQLDISFSRAFAPHELYTKPKF